MLSNSLCQLASKAAPPFVRKAGAHLLVVALAITLGDAVAQQPGQSASDKTSWGLGLGVISTQKPYKDIDRESKLLPLPFFENRYLQLFGPTLEVKLSGLGLGDPQRLDFRLVAQMNLDGAGYEADDAPVLNGMAEREGGYWAGAKAKWRNGFADVGIEWLADVSNNSKGQRLSLSLERGWRLGEKLMLTPRVGIAWVDDNYVDYYFGVRKSEALAGRPAYVGKSGLMPGVGVRAVYRFDNHHAAMFDARAVKLADSIKDSPLVDASVENRLLLSYMYRF